MFLVVSVGSVCVSVVWLVFFMFLGDRFCMFIWCCSWWVMVFDRLFGRLLSLFVNWVFSIFVLSWVVLLFSMLLVSVDVCMFFMIFCMKSDLNCLVVLWMVFLGLCEVWVLSWLRFFRFWLVMDWKDEDIRLF